MGETAKDIQNRIQKAIAQEIDPYVEDRKCMLRECIDIKVTHKEIDEEEKSIAKQLFQGKPWPWRFFFGKVRQSQYAVLFSFFTFPLYQIKAEFISGYVKFAWTLNAILIASKILRWVGALLIIVSFYSSSWKLAVAGVICWVLWYFAFNNILIYLLIKVTARLSVYDKIVTQKGKFIIMEIT